MLILPGNPLYYETLATAKPPNYGEVAATALDNVALVADVETGLLRAVRYEDQLWDYLIGGEYEVRQEQMQVEDDLLGQSWAVD